MFGLVLMLMVGAAIGGLELERRLVAPELAAASTALADAEARAAALTDTLRILRRAAEAVAAPTVADARRSSARTEPRPRRAARVPARAEPLRLAEGVVLPVQGRISSGFARRRLHPILRINRPHLGVDLAAPSGTPIVAPASGRVTFAGRKIGFGLVVEIEHEGGVTTRYAHCSSTIARVGQQVTQGETIATVGRTGLATAPHLHYEVRVKGSTVNPLRHVFPQPPPPPASVADTAVDSAAMLGSMMR